MQVEAEGVVALHDDFRNKRAAQLCVGAVEEVRPILQQGYQLPRPLGGGWYFKIYRPKKQQATDAAEDYGDDYDDTPPWEDEDETESEDEA